MTNKQSQYVNKLLAQCKSWGGPVVSIPELEAVMKRHHDEVETVVRPELTYYKHAPIVLKSLPVHHSSECHMKRDSAF